MPQPIATSPAETFSLPKTSAELQLLLDQLYGPTESRAKRANPVRCSIYGRLSKADPNSVQYSIDIQTNRTVEYARAEQMEIVGIYNDTGATGRNSKRAGLQLTIQDIKARQINVVLFHRVDRSFRNLGSLIKFMSLAARYHVRVVFVTEQFDTNSPGGRMMLYMAGAFAEFYVLITSDRVREMKEARYAAGLPNGSRRLGYCNGRCSQCSDPNGPGYCPLVGGPDRGDGRVLVPHPIEQHAERLIAYLYRDGWSYRDIADYLNSNQFRLPDGSIIKFRTKGTVGQSAPGSFTADGVRIRILSPFSTGYVARYASQPLNMDDDPEHPDRKPEQPQGDSLNRRIPLELRQGRHEAIIPFDVWQRNQLIRRSKGRVSTSQAQPRRVSPFTDTTRCWECYDYDGSIASVRCSTGSTDGRGYGRCGRCQDASDTRRQRAPLPASDGVLESLKLTAQPVSRELANRHHGLPIDKIAQGYQSLIERLVIPPSWHDLIIAYYLDDDGLVEYKRQAHELQQAIEQVRSRHADQLLNRSQAIEKISQINAQLRRLQPSAHPAAGLVMPFLQDFSTLWPRLEPIEQRGLLKAMFTGVFFDAQSQMRLILPNSPFDTLLDLDGDPLSAT